MTDCLVSPRAWTVEPFIEDCACNIVENVHSAFLDSEVVAFVSQCYNQVVWVVHAVFLIEFFEFFVCHPCVNIIITVVVELRAVCASIHGCFETEDVCRQLCNVAVDGFQVNLCLVVSEGVSVFVCVLHVAFDFSVDFVVKHRFVDANERKYDAGVVFRRCRNALVGFDVLYV